MEVHGKDETRSFMFVRDLVSIIGQLYLHKEYNNKVVNIGNSTETKILDLAEAIRRKLNIIEPVKPLESIPGSPPVCETLNCPFASATSHPNP